MERKFGEIRGLGGGFCLHPTELQFRQRLGQSLKLQVLKDDSYDLLSLKKDFPILHTNEDQALTLSSLSATATASTSDIESDGLDNIGQRILTKMKHVQDLSDCKDRFFTDLKDIRRLFNATHPKAWDISKAGFFETHA